MGEGVVVGDWVEVAWGRLVVINTLALLVWLALGTVELAYQPVVHLLTHPHCRHLRQDVHGANINGVCMRLQPFQLFQQCLTFENVP